ncbi:MAG: HAMP domain-containing histidine kinase, partial [Chlorobi bacterium]|nr:HAMP domain-containing histidine kinase [Chlorobiota bacterium]
MKLLSKTSLLIITVSIFIFMAGNITFFYVLKHMINKHVTNELKEDVLTLKKKIKENKNIINSISINKDISVKEIKPNIYQQQKIKDTVLFNTLKKKYIPYKSISFTTNIKNKRYLVTIYKSMLSSNNLIEKITVASIIMVVIFLGMIYILNRFIFVKVWSDFFDNLKKVRSYNINSRKKLNLNTSEIDEFNKLKDVLLQMTERIRQDFQNLKELTENTSHEIQTPLAIIKSKAELLLQSENIKEKDAELIFSILNTSERLSKLNKSLLMISKIENNQFNENQTLNIKNVVNKIIKNFDILFEAGEFNLKFSAEEFYIKINPVLLDVLISNLIKNAIAHTKKGNEINIKIYNYFVKISNHGNKSDIVPENLFKRFKKGKTNKNGT